MHFISPTGAMATISATVATDVMTKTVMAITSGIATAHRAISLARPPMDNQLCKEIIGPMQIMQPDTNTGLTPVVSAQTLPTVGERAASITVTTQIIGINRRATKARQDSPIRTIWTEME